MKDEGKRECISVEVPFRINKGDQSEVNEKSDCVLREVVLINRVVDETKVDRGYNTSPCPMISVGYA